MKYVIITGATGGLGKAFSYKMAEKGENLILVGRTMEKLNNLKTDILDKFKGVDIKLFTCDLTDKVSRQKLFNDIKDLNLQITKLINVAGVDTQMAFENYTQEKLLFQIKVNLEATISITKYVLDLKNGQLDILTVSSLCGVTPMPYFAVYSATKSALINFFDAIRYELKGKDVKISTLMPGSIPTRQDIIEDIKKQGLTGKLSSKSPNYVVKVALKQLEKNKRHIVPGFYNKIVYFFSKITPYSLQSKIIAKKFSIKQKDAF